MRRPFLLYYGIEGMISNQKTVFAEFNLQMQQNSD